MIEYDPERVLDIYVAREALEGMAARLAAENATSRQLSSLKANLAQQKQHLKRGELDEYHAAAVNFHEQLAHAASSVTLERLLGTVFAQIRAMRAQRKNSPPMHLPHSCADHEKLLSAIEKRDRDRAEQIARSHIRDLTSQVRSEISLPTSPRKRNASQLQSNSSS